MTQKTWNSLSFFEQLSNIDGDVERLVRNHEQYKAGQTEKDYSEFYFDKINKLIRMTIFDPKNSRKGYRSLELLDELNEIRQYLNGQYPAEYITNYWNEYTKAIS